jgi:hypothetical protein
MHATQQERSAPGVLPALARPGSPELSGSPNEKEQSDAAGAVPDASRHLLSMEATMNRILWLCGLAAVLLVTTARADDKSRALFEAMRKASAPGPFHKKLEPLVGNWNWTARCWLEPGKSPLESSGTCERKWILGGRILMEEVVSKDGFDGGFQGLGLMGYDNQQKKYVTAWTDTLNSGIECDTGTVDEAGKVFTFHGERVNAATGQKARSRDVLRIVDDNKQTMEVYKMGLDGKEMKAMELTLTRRK